METTRCDMLTKEQVVQALSGLREPHYERGYVELNLIRDIMLRDGQVSLTVALPQEDQEERDRLTKLISSIIEEIGGGKAHIRFRGITDIDRENIEKQINSTTSGHATH